jgi:sarcosine oxidase subunit beta
VIVGAGIMGVSTAYHLARRRAGRVVVVERDGICEGSTALASGGIRHQYANRIGIELTLNVIETFERFEDEFGVDPQFRQHGYLILAATEAELALARRNLALQRSLGVDVTLLSPEETGGAFRIWIPATCSARPTRLAMAMPTRTWSRRRWPRGPASWGSRFARARR